MTANQRTLTSMHESTNVSAQLIFAVHSSIRMMKIKSKGGYHMDPVTPITHENMDFAREVEAETINENKRLEILEGQTKRF